MKLIEWVLRCSAEWRLANANIAQAFALPNELINFRSQRSFNKKGLVLNLNKKFEFFYLQADELIFIGGLQ
jgi:hypothetical protein